MKIETPRLEILPLNSAQMKLLLQGTSFLEQELQLNPSELELDSHTHEAMRYIDEQAGKTPDAYPWISNWQIILKSERISIGSACFMDVPNESGASENIPSHRVLEKCGFKCDSAGLWTKNFVQLTDK